jgi:hypothetical protein
VAGPPPTGRRGQGLLLLRGHPDTVVRWAGRGLAAVHVVALPGWTAVVPVEGRTRSVAPYDDMVTALAARPVPRRLREAVGLFPVEGQALVTAQSSSWRAVRRCLAWQPGTGAVPVPGMPLAGPGHLAAAAGASPAAAAAVRRVLGSRRAEAVSVLAELMEVLGLPGAGLLRSGSRPEGLRGGRLVEPPTAVVERFDTLILEEARHRAELEER